MWLYFIVQNSGVPNEPTRFADWSWTHHFNGETRNRHRCIHSRPHQQHLPAQLRHCGFWATAGTYHSRHCACTWIPEGLSVPVHLNFVLNLWMSGDLEISPWLFYLFLVCMWVNFQRTYQSNILKSKLISCHEQNLNNYILLTHLCTFSYIHRFWNECVL